ncbi:MAG: MBL fold metallo-hydrolase [Candidatus Brocadiaceae bacterium]|nr:MBL fold metallo-hydrolase [Candidatus Brocadiaceae bacterium]
MKLGRFHIYTCLDGFFRLDGGAMFGVVPRLLWQRTNPPDEKNRILLALGCLLIDTGQYRILIDTGVGEKGDEKFHQIYGINRSPCLKASLARYNLSPEDIDIVVNTHLHLDHAGGNTRLEEGKLVPAFHKAEYFIHEGEWKEALSPNERTKASYLTENFLPLKDSGRLRLVREDALEIIKGVSLIRTGGHTPFHQCVRLESEGQTALFLADLVPTTSHIPLPYIMGYDLFPLDTLQKKKELLGKAQEDGWLIIFQHDPLVRAGYLKKTGDKIELAEKVSL